MTSATVSSLALATLTTGIVMVEHFAGVYEASEAVVGYPVYTHELGDHVDRIRERVLAQIPDFPMEATAENFRDVSADVLARWGETIEIERGTDERTASPLATLPDGLWTRGDKVMFSCRSCGQASEWIADPEEYDDDNPHNVCGGSPRCCP